MMTLTLQSTLTCPQCGQGSRELMPTDACLYFHECPHCRILLRPKSGESSSRFRVSEGSASTLRAGSLISRSANGKFIAAIIDSRDFIAARRRTEIEPLTHQAQ